jgi:hypothetical protein
VVHGLHRNDGVDVPGFQIHAAAAPRLDVAGRTLIGSAKLAFAVGMTALAALTYYEIPMF